MQRTFFSTASIFGALAVMFGAFGAHILKEKLTPELLYSFETAVRYQFYHAIALFIAGILLIHTKSKFIKWAGVSFILGILFFSGSLYLLSTHEIIGLSNYKWLGPITPLGGLCFISGWICIVLGSRKINS